MDFAVLAQTKKRGIGFEIMCFPLREWTNWRWGRIESWQMFAIGPFRVRGKWLTIKR